MKRSVISWLHEGSVLKDILNDPKRNNFDLIRLFAAVVVIGIHCVNFSSYTWLKYFGALGVPAFFFLSGLLVSGSFYNSTSLKSYLWKRIIRIYPAAIVAILICAVVLGPIVTIFSFKDYFNDSLLYKYISSIFLIQIHFDLPGVFQDSLLKTRSVNASLWSLALEIKMYLFILVWGLIRINYKRELLLIFALLLTYAGVLYGKEAGAFIHRFFQGFYLFPYISAVPLFLFGSVCYHYKERIVIRRYWGLIILLLFILAVEFAFIKYLIHVLLVITLLYAGTFGKNFLKRLTPRSDYSYGLYIYAYPVEQIVVNYIYPFKNTYGLFVITLIITFLLAFLSWNLIEKRVLKYKKFIK